MLSNCIKQRRPWTPAEDRSLIYLRENLKIKRWPEISKKMFTMFRQEGRTEKQCRDRYENFLKNAQESYDWGPEDEKRMVKLYYEIGNKWSEISTHFPGTNGIFIKNKFYSRLRKAVRHINLIIQSSLYNQFEKFTFGIIFKLVNAATNKNHFSSNCEVVALLENNPNFFEDLIVQLIQMTDDDENCFAKKKKIPRVQLKNELHWRKIIEFLKFLDREFDEGKNASTQKNSEDIIKLEDDHKGVFDQTNSKRGSFQFENAIFLNNCFKSSSKAHQGDRQSAYRMIGELDASNKKKAIKVICSSGHTALNQLQKLPMKPLHKTPSVPQRSLNEKCQIREKARRRYSCGYKEVDADSVKTHLPIISNQIQPIAPVQLLNTGTNRCAEKLEELPDMIYELQDEAASIK